MNPRNKVLVECLTSVSGIRSEDVSCSRDEVTLQIAGSDLLPMMTRLRDDDDFKFCQLIDVAGVDYQKHPDFDSVLGRFAVVYHLLSLENNTRLRVKVFCGSDDQPIIQSVEGVWPSANWFERETYDLFGIVFDGHPDLRRLLTDYGFVGHPLRKDFPLSGHVEMRYDPEQKRVVYQPVTIEPREIVPRVVRDDNYGSVK